ncbi:hypothetical protein DFH11DRAFT_1878384 [Phellopilus nigrolimitatus]|nr:hypothetical protein DFH11DRAFT_1878384 [Phellopilus nigrolimitatus]
MAGARYGGHVFEALKQSLASRSHSDDLTTPSPRAPSCRSFPTASSALSSAPYATADHLHVHISVLIALGMNDETALLLDSGEGRAIARTSLVVDELRRDLICARGNSAAEGKRERARARSFLRSDDRNWLKFLAVLNATFAAPAVADKVRDVRCLFHQLADADGRLDRGALLALLELEKRVCEKGSDLTSVSVSGF